MKRKKHITPNGLIFTLLGGYTADINGENSVVNMQKVSIGLTTYMKQHNLILKVNGNDLKFKKRLF